MKELIKRYLDSGISRRQLVAGLGAAGLSSVAANSMAASLTSATSSAKPAIPPPVGSRTVKGSGGALFVQQLKAAGTEYIFFNPSTGDAPIYDALIDEPNVHIIKGLQEGGVVAMADGYARASGKPGVAIVAAVGLPNAMAQLVNTYKDRIPLLLCMGQSDSDAQSRGGPQQYDGQEGMLTPITKWGWKTTAAAGIPDITRRALKFASTRPGGPVCLFLNEPELRVEATATILDQSVANVPMTIRPSTADTEVIARMLIEAKNPVMTVGDEITLSRGEKEVQQLAELLGLPVMGSAVLGQWSTPFPTRSPLFLGGFQANTPALGECDLHLNMGSWLGEQTARGVRMISIRQDPETLGRAMPVDMGIVADPKLAAADLIEAVRSLVTKDRLKTIADERTRRVSAYTEKARKLRYDTALQFAGGPALKMNRLAIELENFLDKDTVYVADLDSGRNMEPLMHFGGDDKTYIGNGPAVLGWGIAAGLGVKLARPDKPVVALVGDGSFYFGGPTPLWSLARYEAPITVIVLNNRSYNNERNRIWGIGGGAQLSRGLDMTCYNGSPDVDIAKTAIAFGVDAEQVDDPEKIKAALQRAKRANIEGRPYLLEMLVERDGIGGASEWHPTFSIADLRTRKV